MVRKDTTGLSNWSELERIKHLWKNTDHIEDEDTEFLMKELEEAWDAWEKLMEGVENLQPAPGQAPGGIKREIINIMASIENEGD